MRAIDAVVVHDLADDARRREAREAREVDGAFGLAGAHEDAAGRALSGKTWPGVTRSSGRQIGLATRRVVYARSCALMPVVTPWRASTLTVNAVPSGGPPRPGSASWVARGASPAPRRARRGIKPRPCVAMK